MTPATDKAILDQPMTMLTADAKAAGGVEGSGSTWIVEHTSDNNLMSFRYKNRDVRMQVAEEDFDLNGHHFRAGAFVIPNADRSRLEPMVRDLGLSAWAAVSAPAVKMHESRIPRIGYVHSWSRTQDEGWVRAALDRYEVPYQYFADQKLAAGNLRAQYDVIIFPHVGGNSVSMINGIAKTGTVPLPYKKTNDTPNLGFVDQTDDIRGGMGFEGLTELAKFVQEGGALIVEGSTASLMAEYVLNSGVTVEHPANLFARGSILRSTIADLKSPIAYGYEAKDLPVYFNQDPVLNAASTGFGGVGLPVRGLEAARPARPWDRTSLRTRRRFTSRRSKVQQLLRPPKRQRAVGGAGAGRTREDPLAAVAARASARRGSVHGQRRKHAALRHSGGRRGSGQPRRRGGRSAWKGPHRDVCAPPVLALANAGNLFPGVQRDPELGPPGCGQKPAGSVELAFPPAVQAGQACRSVKLLRT